MMDNRRKKTSDILGNMKRFPFAFLMNIYSN